MKHLYTLLTVTAVLSFSSCSDTEKQNDFVDTVVDSSTVQDQKEPVGIDGEDIFIYKGPGKSFGKVLNEKATQSLGKSTYCQVDNSTRVIVLEVKEEWSKIQVVVPDWLTDSHIGWIPSKYLLSKETEKSREIGKLNPSDYTIMSTDHNNVVQNFHVLLKRKNFDKEYIYQFSKEFRKEHCSDRCNLSIYDSPVIKDLIGIYPLDDSQYLKMADHLISFSTFDATEVRDWYPYQDFHYKELGGKNFR